jgi:hypothetical protein
VLSVKRIAARVPLGSYHTASRNVHGCMKQERRREVKGSENSNRPDPSSMVASGVPGLPGQLSPFQPLPPRKVRNWVICPNTS